MNSKGYMHPNIHRSIINNNQDMEATCPLTDGWRKEMWYINNGILLSYKNEILPFATTWTDPESLRKTNTVYYHLYVESKKANEYNRKETEYRCRG